MRNGYQPKSCQLLTPSMPLVTPTFKHCIEVRFAKDGVYDVWVDGAWTFSRTSYQNVLTELEKLFTIFDPTT